jgi:transglutaminase-like putative cysteine protease
MRTGALVVLAALTSLVGLGSPAGADPAPPTSWEVTIAMRVEPEPPGPFTLRVALPDDSYHQRVVDVDVRARGLDAKLERTDPHPHVRIHGRLRDARRVSVTFRVETDDVTLQLPPITRLDDPPAGLLPYLVPAPLFQSRSILVREFLESQVAPELNAAGTAALLETLLRVTRREIEHRRDGKSLALDVLRRRAGKRIGIERLFTTFLRCARVPARFVEGVNLKSSTRKKRVFWTEVWAEDRWWPVSASANRIGRLPRSYVALARDGTRVVQAEGARVGYSVQAVAVGAKRRTKKDRAEQGNGGDS